MDDVLGIVRKDASSANVQQNAQVTTTFGSEQSERQAKSFDGSSKICSGNGTTEPYFHQDGSSGEVQGAPIPGERPSDTHTYSESFMEENLFDVDESDEQDSASTDEEAVPTRIKSTTKWTTAHGINSDGANLIYTKAVYVCEETLGYFDLHLPKSRGSPKRPWTEEEKKDFRVYIQDYGIEDWEILSESMGRTETDLPVVYLEVVAARNRRAGRPARDGIPKTFPNLAHPPPPKKPSRVMGPRKCNDPERIRRNILGDFSYDIRATAFPKVTRDGIMVDSKGNPLSGTTSHSPTLHSVRNRS